MSPVVMHSDYLVDEGTTRIRAMLASYQASNEFNQVKYVTEPPLPNQKAWNFFSKIIQGQGIKTQLRVPFQRILICLPLYLLHDQSRSLFCDTIIPQRTWSTAPFT